MAHIIVVGDFSCNALLLFVLLFSLCAVEFSHRAVASAAAAAALPSQKSNDPLPRSANTSVRFTTRNKQHHKPTKHTKRKVNLRNTILLKEELKNKRKY